MEFSVGLIVSYDGNLSDMAKLGNPAGNPQPVTAEVFIAGKKHPTDLQRDFPLPDLMTEEAMTIYYLHTLW